MTRPPLLLLMVLFLAPLAAPPAHADDRWNRYQVLLWQERSPAQLEGLAAIGFTGVKLQATGGNINSDARARALRAGLPYYLENLATDFYASYHRYTPDHPITWLFDQAKARYAANPADPSVFIRTPGLSDPVWLETVRTRVDRVVRAEAPNRPLFYNLADEAGIADLAAAWDADIGPSSLAGFREWLQTQYASLDTLNAEWGTAYAAWADIRPELTDAALRRTDQNFSAWSDFKAWMETAFARSLRAGSDAVHAADPTAIAGLEGAQIPGWGGYDYTLLARAVDLMEIYDNGEALDLAMAFNPALIPLRTSFDTGPRELHGIWRHVLHGGRGMIVWDEADDVVGPDGRPGPRGLEITAVARAVTPVAALLREAQPDPDPVAILYDTTSFRLRWLLDRRAADHDWTARDAEREYDDNAWRASRRIMVRRLAELGIQPRFLANASLATALADGSVKVLLLPHAIALSDAAIETITGFQAAGGTVLADTEVGLFDGHARRRATQPLPGIPHPQAIRPDGDESSPSMHDALAALLREAGAPPRMRLLGPDRRTATGIEARWYRHATGQILALQTGRAWGGPARLTLRLPIRMAVSDLRAGGDPIVTDRLEITLDPIEPTLLLLAVP